MSLRRFQIGKVVTSQREVPDFFAALICHKVFERFPRLRVASVENGAGWIKSLKASLYRGHAQTRGYYAKNLLDQFDEHIWVTPFREDDCEELVTHIPVERIIFGSDWPHLEGVEEPIDFLESIENFGDADKRLVMRENSHRLTAMANA
jgi:predicted TIM-barrel fold metal-dependent hydrolase